MKENETLEIHPGLSILREEEKENIYPQGTVRIVVKGNYLKITANYGFSIAAEISKAQESMRMLNWTDDFSYEKMAKKFRVVNGEFRMHADERIKSLLKEIYRLLDAGDGSKVRLRVMEVIARIDEKGSEDGKKLPVSDECSPSQAVLARSVYSYMMIHMNKHVTVTMLSAVFGVSDTQVKDSFKKYYGESIFSFIRKEKMHVAASMLKETDIPVVCIAEKCGYSSAGKFSKVFFEIMEATPREYRNQT